MTAIFEDREFLTALKAELETFPKLAHADNQAVAERIASSARGHVHVLSGQTRDAIGVTTGTDWVEVGTDPGKVDNDKALSEEFGTHDQGPRPFMRPAIDEEAQ